MEIAIKVSLPAWHERAGVREAQAHQNRIAEVLKLMASRLSNGGGGDMQFEHEGLKAEMRVVASPSNRNAA